MQSDAGKSKTIRVVGPLPATERQAKTRRNKRKVNMAKARGEEKETKRGRRRGRGDEVPPARNRRSVACLLGRDPFCFVVV